MSYRNEFLAKYGHADHLHQVIDDKESGDFYSNHIHAAKTPSLDHTHIAKLIRTGNAQVKKIVAAHQNISDDNVEKLMGDQSYNVDEVKKKVMSNPNVKPHAIKKAFDDGDRETQKLIGMHRDLPKGLRDHVMKNSYDPEVHRVVKSRIEYDKRLDDFFR